MIPFWKGRRRISRRSRRELQELIRDKLWLKERWKKDSVGFAICVLGSVDTRGKKFFAMVGV